MVKCSYREYKTVMGETRFVADNCEMFNNRVILFTSEKDVKDFVRAANRGAKRDELTAIYFRNLERAAGND